MLNIIGLDSTGLHRSSRLSNKLKQTHILFAVFSLAVIVSCEVAKRPHIFLTRYNQDTQDINRHFGGTLNHFGPMCFAKTTRTKLILHI